MAEQFAVYRAFGDRSAVDGKIFLAASRRVVVYYTWNNLFTHTAFADYEYREICRCDLHGHIDGAV